MKIKKFAVARIVREEIASLKKEDVALPANIKRFMDKLTVALKDKGLNRKRQTAILGGVISALGIDSGQLMKMVRMAKKDNSSETIPEDLKSDEKNQSVNEAIGGFISIPALGAPMNYTQKFSSEKVVEEGYDDIIHYPVKKVSLKIPSMTLKTEIRAYDSSAHDSSIISQPFNVEMDSFENNIREQFEKAIPGILKAAAEKAYKVKLDSKDSYIGASFGGIIPKSVYFHKKK